MLVYVLLLVLFVSAFCYARKFYLPQQVLLTAKRMFVGSGVAVEKELRLDRYSLVKEAVELDGVTKLAGAALDEESQTLKVLADNYLIDIAKDGKILERTRLVGFSSPSGIALLGPGRLAIAEGREGSIVLLNSEGGSTALDASKGSRFHLHLDGIRGYSGIDLRRTSNEIVVVSRGEPATTYCISGVPFQARSELLSISITDCLSMSGFWRLKDISDIAHDSWSDNFLFLSRSSQVLLEVNRKGRVISMLSLRGGLSGLKRDVPRPVGVALDSEQRLYILSEPNFIYIFEPHN